MTQPKTSDNEDARLPREVEQRSYTGDPDDWTIDDPQVGPGVPLCVRRAGATGPMEREEIGENGVALRGHAADYECPECGEVIRLVTSAVETQHRCSECREIRWFRVSEVDYAE